MQPPESTEESSDNSLDSRILATDSTSRRVEASFSFHCTSLYRKSEADKGGERIRKLHQTNSSGNARQAKEIRNRTGNDKGNNPVDWDQNSPQDLASLGGQRWGFKKLHENVVVDDLDTNVAVKRRSNYASITEMLAAKTVKEGKQKRLTL